MTAFLPAPEPSRACSAGPGLLTAGNASIEPGPPNQFLDNPRIALLPPLVRRAKAADVMLAEALVDDIAMGLCALHSVSVVAPYTSGCLRSEPDWLGHLERNNVQYILDTRSSPEGLLLQLVFLPSDTMIWATRHALQVTTLPEQRRDIARTITVQIAQELESNEVFYADYVRNARAYHLYLTGINRLKKVTLPDILWARKAFEQALDEHKTFAPALSGLSRTLSVEWLIGGRNDQGLLQAAEMAAREAVAQNPLSPLGHRELGVARLYQGDVDQSVEALSTSVGLGPHYADAIYSLADSLVHASRPAEGMATIERALSLNFIPPDMYLWCAAGASFFLERYEEAIGFIGRMKVSAPAARLAAATWGMLGNGEEAARERTRVLQRTPNFDLEAWLSAIPIKDRWQKDMYRTGLRKAGF
jgi:tetratricopeptide (TPR) repeat protein